jgi:hypothetical protein
MFFNSKSPAKSPVSSPERNLGFFSSSIERLRSVSSRTKRAVGAVAMLPIAFVGSILPNTSSADAATKKKAKVTKVSPITTIPKTIGTNPNELGLKTQSPKPKTSKAKLAPTTTTTTISPEALVAQSVRVKLDRINSDIFRSDLSSNTSPGSGSSICTEGYATVNTGTSTYRIENPLIKLSTSDGTEAKFKPFGSLFSYFTKGDVIAASNFGKPGTLEGVDIGFLNLDIATKNNPSLKVRLFSPSDEEYTYSSYRNMPLGTCETLGRTASNTFRMEAGGDITNGVKAVYTAYVRNNEGKLVEMPPRDIIVNRFVPVA